MKANHIRQRSQPECYFCGDEGHLLYVGLRDVLFGVPGEWNFRMCPNTECGLVWLDPMPIPEDFGAVYENYYTHNDHSEGPSRTRWPGFLTAYNILLRVSFIQRDRERLAAMCLLGRKPAKLLEIGCGDGTRLVRMKEMGWEVAAVEPDPKAADHASRVNGLSVFVGTLEEAKLSNSSFDAVIMNHVIEHVHDPLVLLRECHRVLKQGGALIAVTPNTHSFGHRRFRQYWRGLEPPRHTFLFSPGTLHRLASEAGFEKCVVRTTAANAETLVRGSMQIVGAAKPRLKASSQVLRGVSVAGYQIGMALLQKLKRDSGEECVLKAIK
jgi:SAM-dependent methyltransferase